MSEAMKVGILGCGNICQAYFNGCKMFPILEVKSCTDIAMDAARKAAQENGVEAVSWEEMLADPEIDIVVNLTIPKVHAELSLQALEAGKHVHSEKPYGINVAEGRQVLDAARSKGLRAGSAPDTFLGAGLQTCRKMIDDGWIGRPIGGTAFMLGRGPESWHPNPAFFYQTGGGPMLDMGPYYITALVHLLGPVKAVAGMTSKAYEQRLATCKEHFGELLPVEVPTHNSGSLLFQNGAVVTVGISFDVQRHCHKPIEIYGTDGSLGCPDPNTFGGPVTMFRPGNDDWQEQVLAFDYRENSRGIGVADMAHGIQAGRPHRCDASVALHVLEVMMAFEKSSEAQAWVEIENQCEQPAAFPLGMVKGVLD